MRRQLVDSGVVVRRADSELMAADIFTKPFSENARDIWEANLQLVNIYDSKTVESDLVYAADDKYSLRGDMKKMQLTKVVPDAPDTEFCVDENDGAIGHRIGPMPAEPASVARAALPVSVVRGTC